MNTLFLLLAVSSTPNYDANAVVRIVGSGMCSATIVSSDGLILSAEHCGCEGLTRAVFLNGDVVPIKQIFEPTEKQGRDECAILQIQLPGPWPFIPVARAAPPIGATVRMLGYPVNEEHPRGEWYASEAEIIAGTARKIWLRGFDKRAGPGLSGGPLINTAGELVGICTGAGGSDTVGGATVTGPPIEDGCLYMAWGVVKESLDAVDKYERARSYRNRPVVAFVAKGCGPCLQLQRDIAAGHFSQFDMTVYEYDPVAGWESEAAEKAYARMFVSVAPKPAGFPIIWVEGTAHHRVGYSPQHRGGILGFLRGILEGLVRVVAGEPPESPVPPPVDADTGQIRNPGAASQPVVKLPDDYQDLVDAVKKAREDLAALKTGNILEKAKAAAALKGDLATIRAEASQVKRKAEDDPAQMLWGLLGIVSGLAHRRLAA